MDNNNIPEIEKVNYSLEDIAVEKLEKTQRKLNKFSSVNMEDPVIQEIDNTIDTIKSSTVMSNILDMAEIASNKRKNYSDLSLAKNLINVENNQNKRNLEAQKQIEKLKSIKENYSKNLLKEELSAVYNNNITPHDPTKRIAHYDFGSNVANTFAGLGASLLQGSIGPLLDIPANTAEILTTAAGVISKNPLELVTKPSKVWKNFNKEIERNDQRLEQTHGNVGSQIVNNLAAVPLQKYKRDLNFVSNTSWKNLKEGFDNGILEGVANTLNMSMDLLPSTAEVGVVAATQGLAKRYKLPQKAGTLAGTGLLAGKYLNEADKERIAEELKINPNEVMYGKQSHNGRELLAAAGEAAFAIPELLFWKNALKGNYFGKDIIENGVIKTIEKYSGKEGVEKILKQKAEDIFGKEFIENASKSVVGKTSSLLGSTTKLGAKGSAILATDAVMEGLLSEVPQEIFHKIGNNDWKNKSFKENMNEVVEAGLVGAAAGAGMGAGIRTASIPVTKLLDNIEQNKNENIRKSVEDVLSAGHKDKFAEYAEKYKDISEETLQAKREEFDTIFNMKSTDENGELLRDDSGKTTYESWIETIKENPQSVENLKELVYLASSGLLDTKENSRSTSMLQARQSVLKTINENSELADGEFNKIIEKEPVINQMVYAFSATDTAFLADIIESLIPKQEEVSNDESPLNAPKQSQESSSDKQESNANKIDYDSIYKKASRAINAAFKLSERLYGKDFYSKEEKKFIKSLLKTTIEHAKNGNYTAISASLTGHISKDGQKLDSVYGYLKDIMSKKGKALNQIKSKVNNFLNAQQNKLKLYESTLKNSETSTFISFIPKYSVNDNNDVIVVSKDNFADIKKLDLEDFENINTFNDLIGIVRNRETNSDTAFMRNNHVYLISEKQDRESQNEVLSKQLSLIAAEVSMLEDLNSLIDSKISKGKTQESNTAKNDSKSNKGAKQTSRRTREDRENEKKEKEVQAKTQSELQVNKILSSAGVEEKHLKNQNEFNKLSQKVKDKVKEVINNSKDNIQKFITNLEEYPVIKSILDELNTSNMNLNEEENTEVTAKNQEEQNQDEIQKEQEESQEENEDVIEDIEENSENIKGRDRVSQEDFINEVKDKFGWTKFTLGKDRQEKLIKYLTQRFATDPDLINDIRDFTLYDINEVFKNCVETAFTQSKNYTPETNNEIDNETDIEENLKEEKKEEVTPLQKKLEDNSGDRQSKESILNAKWFKNLKFLANKDSKIAQMVNSILDYVYPIFDKFKILNNEHNKANKLIQASNSEDIKEINDRVREAFSFMRDPNNFIESFDHWLGVATKTGIAPARGIYIEGKIDGIRINNAIKLVQGDRVVRIAMMIQAMQTLLHGGFSRVYDVNKILENLEKIYGVENLKPLTTGEILRFDGGMFRDTLFLQTGKSVATMLGLKPKNKEISNEQESIFYKELGFYVVETLKNMGLIEEEVINRSDILDLSNEEKSNGATISIYRLKNIDGQSNVNGYDKASKTFTSRVKNSIFSKDHQDTDALGNPIVVTTSTFKEAFTNIQTLFEDLGLEKTDNRKPVSFGTPHEEYKGITGMDTNGVPQSYPKALINAINSGINTPWVSQSFEFMSNLGILNKEILVKAHEKYKEDNHILMYHEKDSQKGKNLGIENEVEKLLEFVEESKDENGKAREAFFDFRMSANMREFLQTLGINPQTHKLARFLLLPKSLFTEFRTDENGMIVDKNGNIHYAAIQALAQGFGFGTDKKYRETSRKIGKAILELAKTKEDYEALQEAFVDSIKNAQEYEFEIRAVNNQELQSKLDKIKADTDFSLNFKELGHAIATMNSLEKYANRDSNGKFTTAITQEVDGINNGLALKLLQYMFDPKYLELLRSTGIDAFNQASDAIANYLNGKDENGKSIQKVLDLYEQIAVKLSEKVEQETSIFTDKEKAKSIIKEEYKKRGVNISDKEIKKEIENRQEQLTHNLLATLGLEDFMSDKMEKISILLMKFIQNNFAAGENGEVLKKTRDNTKPIGHVFTYGAGFNAQANKISMATLESLPEEAFKALLKKYLNEVDENSIEDAKEKEKIEAYKKHLGLPLDEKLGELELNESEQLALDLLTELEVFDPQSPIDTVTGIRNAIYEFTNGVKIGEVIYSLLDIPIQLGNSEKQIPLRKIISTSVKGTIKGIIENTMNEIFPLVKIQNDLTNDIYNTSIGIAKAILNSKIAKFKEKNPNTMITKAIMNTFMEEINNIIPGIKLSLASEAELEAVKNDPMVKNNTEIKRTGKGSKVDYSSTIKLDYNNGNGGKSSKSIHPSVPTLEEVGASSNVFQIHQEDGSSIAITMQKSSVMNEDTGKLMRTMIGIFDAEVVDANSAVGTNRLHNQMLFELAKNSKTLAHTLFIAEAAEFNFERMSAEIDSLPNKSGIDVKNNTAGKLKVTVALSNLLQILSLANREVLFNYNISINNIQNNLEGSAYQYRVDNALDANVAGQTPNELMLSVSEGTNATEFKEIIDSYNELMSTYRNSAELQNKKEQDKLNKNFENLLDKIYALQTKLKAEWNEKRFVKDKDGNIIKELKPIHDLKTSDTNTNLIDTTNATYLNTDEYINDILSTLQQVKNSKKNKKANIEAFKELVSEALQSGIKLTDIVESILESTYIKYETDPKTREKLLGYMKQSPYISDSIINKVENLTEKVEPTSEEEIEKEFSEIEKKALEEEPYNPFNSQEQSKMDSDEIIYNEQTLSENLEGNTKDVLKLKSQMREIDKENGRELDEEESNRLSDILSAIVTPMNKALDKVKVILKRTTDNVNSGSYDPRTNSIVVKASDAQGAEFKGFMSNEEIYAHEVIHPASHYTIRQNGGNNKFTHILSKIYRMFLTKVNENTIVEALEEDIVSLEKRQEIAKCIYDHITNHKDPLTNLEEFNTIGLSSKVMSKILKSIKFSKDGTDSLYDNLSSAFVKAFEMLFGDHLKDLNNVDNLYDALKVLNIQMANANNKAKLKLAQQKAKTKAVKLSMRNKLDGEVSKLIKSGIKKTSNAFEKAVLSRLGLSKDPKLSNWNNFKSLVAEALLAFTRPDYNRRIKAIANSLPVVNFKTTIGSVIDDLSTPSTFARIAQNLHRESNTIDQQRNWYEKQSGEVIKRLYTQDLSKKDSEVLGELILNTDLPSLDYSSDEIIELLGSEQELQENLDIRQKELFETIDNLYEHNKKMPIQNYKRFIINQGKILANYMVTGRKSSMALQPNAYSIANLVGRTNSKIEVDSEIVKLLDEYISLLALQMTDTKVKERAYEILSKDKQAFYHTMYWFRNFSKISKEANSGGNEYQRAKGYREFIEDPLVDLKLSFKSKEADMAKIGYKKIPTNIARSSIKYFGGEHPVHYINTSIPAGTNFDKTTFRYISNMYEGTTLNDMFTKEMFDNPKDFDTLKTKYAKIKSTMKKDVQLAFELSESNKEPDLSKDVGFMPLYTERGIIATFSYTPNYNIRNNIMGINNDLFDNIGKLQAVHYDREASKILNEKVVEELKSNYNETSDSTKRLEFVEVSNRSKDPDAREVYRILPDNVKKELEDAMDGTIKVRKDVFYRYFGYRGMNIKNTKWYKHSNTPFAIKKAAVFSLEFFKKMTQIFKIETVVKTPAVVTGNFISNLIQCWNHGMSFSDTLRFHMQAIKDLKNYKEVEYKLNILREQEKAGVKINKDILKSLEKELELNSCSPLIKAGFLNTISEDLNNTPTGYYDRKWAKKYEELKENSLGKVVAKGVDYLWLTENTTPGKALSAMMRYADFTSRYTLYYGLKSQGKLSENEIIDVITDAFIDYDAPVSKGIKAANEYGLALFTRFFTKSQRLMANHFINRPVSTTALLLTQFLTRINVSDIYDTIWFNKDITYMVNPVNPLYNVIDSVTPSISKWLPIWDLDVNRNKSIMENLSKII